MLPCRLAVCRYLIIGGLLRLIFIYYVDIAVVAKTYERNATFNRYLNSLARLIYSTNKFSLIVPYFR